ncbi:MAG: glycosyltransferase [Actinomycetota bacterium]|nr:glycosyltransferase [Actinomycetota bacterium]
MESQPTAPPVVAVVVTCDPGPWFDEALTSLGHQDYANLSVLVVDSASSVDPSARVAAALPNAFVQRLSTRVDYGVATNEALEVVEGASFFLLCHDDVALDQNAVTIMVEEAFRSNAGVITPKLVEWHRPERLLAVGAGADRQGIVHPMVEPGELDQEQHDAVRDVFVAPSGATLVRADLFASIGGFADDIAQFGEDLDLSWRVQLAGARIVAAPGARVRHLEVEKSGQRRGWTAPLDRRRAVELAEQHRLRSVLTCYGRIRLLRTLPLLVIYLAGESLWALVRGHAGEAGAVLRAAGRAVANPAILRATRQANQRHRRVRDAELARLQTRGNVRLRGFIRSFFSDGPLPGIPVALGDDEAEAMALTPADQVSGSGRDLSPETAASVTSSIGRGSWRLPVGFGLILAVILVFGSRSLLGHDLPAIGQFPTTAGGPGGWWSAWWSNTSRGGLGGSLLAAPGLALLGLAGSIFLGAVGTLQHVLVLAPLVIGPLGAYRAARWWGSLRGRVAAMVVYAIVPLPFNALAGGRWAGLLAFAAAPWTLGVIGRLSSLMPFPPSVIPRLTGRLVGLGLLTALVGAFAPSWLYVVPVIGLALFLGSLLVSPAAAAVRLVAVPVAASLIALILLAPWSLRVLGNGTDTFGVFPGPTVRQGLGEILRFHTGPVGAGALGWGFLVAAALPLVIGRSWRLAWAARLWIVALACFALAWAGLRGWIPVPDPEVVLAPAAAALASAVALGAVAFELDLPGYRFGWRQAASGLAAAAVVVAAIPMLLASGGGHWKIPSSDPGTALSFLSGQNQGNYRVLWVGAPRSLPLGSRELSTGVAYATSFGGAPNVTYLWPSAQVGSTQRIADDLGLSGQRRTTTLGRLLAPLSVRYIVIPNQTGPAGSGGAAVPVPATLLAGLSLQTDLLPVSPDTSYSVYLNAAWKPTGPPPVLHASSVHRVVEILDVVLWGAAIAVVILDRRRRAVSRVVEAVQPQWFTPISRARRIDAWTSGSRSGLSSGEADYDADEVWVDD